MGISRKWCIIFVITAACTCGVRTECKETARISFLTGLHDDPSCTKLSPRGVMLFEAAKLLTEIHNNKTDGSHIEITVLDTCESVMGALKAVMKALVWADTDCLHPPHYLGIIGPDTVTNAEAVLKVTSILKVPHIVRKPSSSPYLHHLAEKSNSYIVQGILRIIEILKWKSFTLIANVRDHNDDDVQDIAKKLTMNAIAKSFCVIVRDDDEEDYTSHIVHIGIPETKFFNKSMNATVLIVSEGNLKDYLNRINSNYNILLLQESRNAFDDLKWRVEKSQLWAPESGRGKYNVGELDQVKWLDSAIEIYAKALNALCKGKKCKNQMSPLDWNNIISNILTTHNAESQAAPTYLDLFMKTKVESLECLGGVVVRKNGAKVYWGERKSYDEQKDDTIKKTDENHGAEEIEEMPYAFKRLLNREKVLQANCVTTIKKIRLLHEKDNEAAHILVTGMSDSEWWTMVWTVSGVGVAMFLVGALAVYVIYVNIRGPRYPKDKDHLDRDTSLRRVGSDKELPTAVTIRNQRASRTPQRTGSNRSSISEKSV